MAIQVLNTDSDLTGKTIITAENAYTISGLHTFSRNPGAPFAVSSGSAFVANLGCDAAQIGGSGTVPTARLGSGSASTASFLRGDSTWASSALVFLKAGNGTDTNAAATTVDSIALSGLTANDTILVDYYCESVTQSTVNPQLYSVTDAGTILILGAPGTQTLTAGATFMGRVTIKQRQGASTTYTAGSIGVGGSIANPFNANYFTATTAWTGSWTLGWRHGGVTAGGTYKWQWSVYRLTGQ